MSVENGAVFYRGSPELPAELTPPLPSMGTLDLLGRQQVEGWGLLPMTGHELIPDWTLSSLGPSLVGRFSQVGIIPTGGDCQRCTKKSLHSLRNSSRGKSIEILEGFLIVFPVARPKILKIGRIQHKGAGGCRPSLESAARCERHDQ
jgi:hypothetical protein